jgi:Holliday junction resolvase RusA-like endonuclease
MLLAAFVVPGQPVPKARARVVGRHAYTPRRTRDAELRIAQRLVVTHPHLRPSVARLRAVLRFHIKGQRGDADNFGKLVLDALQGRAYVNDSQVDQVDLTMVRCSPEPRTEIELWQL